MSNQTSPPKKWGRPPKNAVAQKRAGSRGVVGRPKGETAIINEYKARMLASPKSEKVLSAIYNAALDDDHKNQAAAWKLIMDRFLPLSYFEKDGQSSGRASARPWPSRIPGTPVCTPGHLPDGRQWPGRVPRPDRGQDRRLVNARRGCHNELSPETTARDLTGHVRYAEPE